MEKEGIKVLLDLCKYSDKKPLPVLANACRTLFHLSKNSPCFAPTTHPAPSLDT